MTAPARTGNLKAKTYYFCRGAVAVSYDVLRAGLGAVTGFAMAGTGLLFVSGNAVGASLLAASGDFLTTAVTAATVITAASAATLGLATLTGKKIEKSVRYNARGDDTTARQLGVAAGIMIPVAAGLMATSAHIFNASAGARSVEAPAATNGVTTKAGITRVEAPSGLKL